MFFENLYKILNTTSIEKKEYLTSKLYNNLNQYSFKRKFFKDIEPSYNKICKVVSPKKVKRRGFSTIYKRAVFLHSLAHIEYSAIDLAIDSCYRFDNREISFYKDFLEIALDEIKHFKMLNSLLNELGYKYGDFEVHNSLFEAANKASTFKERMAIIPRWYEANGLDANERMLQKISNYNDEFAKKVAQALKIILEEEIPHVKKGDFWFKKECMNQNLDYKNEYFKIIDKFFTNWKKDFINVKARLKAGFSCEEIENISLEKIECKEK